MITVTHSNYDDVVKSIPGRVRTRDAKGVWVILDDSHDDLAQFGDTIVRNNDDTITIVRQ